MIRQRPRIVLYSPQQLSPEGGVEYSKDVTPMSLLTIAGGPVQDGYEVVLIDGAILDQAEAHRQVLEACEGALLYATTGILGYQVADGYLCSKKVKARFPALPMFIGGWFASVAPELQLETGLYDAVGIGQGEITFREIVQAVDAGEPLDDIPGLALWRDGKVHFTETRKATGWRHLPPVPWSIFDFEPYKLQQLAQRGRYAQEMIPVPPCGHDHFVAFCYYTSYGCPLQCSFCCSPEVSGLRWKAMDADHMVDELCELSERYGFDTVRYYDANYGVLERRVRGVAEGLLERGKHLWQTAFLQAPSVARYDSATLEAMRASGFYEVLLGGETGSDETMKRIQKTTRGNQNMEGALALAAAGIRSYITYIIGYPGEDEASMLATLEQARSIQAACPMAAPTVWPYRPIPGTPMYRQSVEMGYQPPSNLLEWGDIGEYRLNPVWQGKISPQVLRRRRLLGHYTSLARGIRGRRQDFWQRRAQRRIQAGDWRLASLEARAFSTCQKMQNGLQALLA